MRATVAQGNWKQKILLFLVGQSITLFGSTLVQMAIIWYVTLQTSSGIWIAAFTIGAYLPQFLISFIGGVWADRYSRKMLIISADAVIAGVTLLMVCTMPYLTQQPVLLSTLLIMSVIRSFGAGIQTPAVGAVIPSIVPQKELMRYNGINATLQSVMQFAAPAAAGVLLSASTLRHALMVDVLTAVVGITLCCFVWIPKQQQPQEQQDFLSDMKTGIDYAFSNKRLRKILIIYGFFIFLSVPAGFLAQLYVSRTYGETYWYLTAVELVGFFGMMSGGLLMSTWGGFQSHAKTLAAGIIAFGILAVGMGLAGSFLLYLILMLFYGVALTMVQTATTTMLQENTAEAMQGRVFGLLGSIYSGALPIGMATFGPLADMLPMKWIMIGSGIALLLLAGQKLDKNI